MKFFPILVLWVPLLCHAKVAENRYCLRGCSKYQVDRVCVMESLKTNRRFVQLFNVGGWFEERLYIEKIETLWQKSFDCGDRYFLKDESGNEVEFTNASACYDFGRFTGTSPKGRKIRDLQIYPRYRSCDDRWSCREALTSQSAPKC